MGFGRSEGMFALWLAVKCLFEWEYYLRLKMRGYRLRRMVTSGTSISSMLMPPCWNVSL